MMLKFTVKYCGKLLTRKLNISRLMEFIWWVEHRNGIVFDANWMEEWRFINKWMVKHIIDIIRNETLNKYKYPVQLSKEKATKNRIKLWNICRYEMISAFVNRTKFNISNQVFFSCQSTTNVPLRFISDQRWNLKINSKFYDFQRTTLPLIFSVILIPPLKKYTFYFKLLITVNSTLLSKNNIPFAWWVYY